MDERIQRLNGIAQQGDNDAFYNINREDVKLLEHINEDVKPSFVNKRNLDGYTPVYLALLMGIQRWCVSFYNTMWTFFVSKEGSV